VTYKIEVKGKVGACDILIQIEGDDITELTPEIKAIGQLLIQAALMKEKAAP